MKHSSFETIKIVFLEESNAKDFEHVFQVLVEGEGYRNVWLETQPMGGAMWAKRDVRLALNNQLIFMRNQRSDGRLPGMITSNGQQLTSWFTFPGQGNMSLLQVIAFCLV